MDGAFPWLRHVFADGAYAGDKLQDALAENGQVDVRGGTGITG